MHQVLLYSSHSHTALTILWSQVVIVDEKRLRELHYNLDMKAIALLETRAAITIHRELQIRNRMCRDFGQIMRFKRLHELCADLGTTMADLMVLYNSWHALLRSIGGYQFVSDLKGPRREYYQKIKDQSLALMLRRQELLKAIEDGLKKEYDKVVELCREVGLRLRNTFWDSATGVEVDAEEEENRECCRREADFELRQKRQTEAVQIAPAPFHPVLLLIDSGLPRRLRSYLIAHLRTYDFEPYPGSQSDGDLLVRLQQMMDGCR